MQENVEPPFRLSTILKPIRLSMPVAMSYIPLGISFGILMTTSHIHWYWAPLSSLLIFAGSIEFLAVSLMISSMSIPQIAWTALIVNFRHIFYGLSFPIEKLQTRVQKMYGVFALTDETYGITSSGEGLHLSGFQITVLQVASHIWWVLGSLIGGLIGRVIPSDIKGFGFSLTAMFVILAFDAIDSSRDIVLVALALLCCCVAFFADKYIYPESFLIVGLVSYLSLLTLIYNRK